MQFNETIAQAFEKKGYLPQSIITIKQFQLVMKQFIGNNHQQQNIISGIVRQIWKQTENKKLSNKQKNFQITTKELIQAIISAIQILDNRVAQCEKTIRQLKQKQLELQKQQNYQKIQILQHKLSTLIKDQQQFQLDFQLITQPFINATNKDKAQIYSQSSMRKYSHRSSIRKISAQHQLEIQQPIQNNQLQKYLKENKGKILQEENVQDQKNVCIWMLVILTLLQATVTIVKFSFINLIIFLLGFFMLLEPYRQNMAKIIFYASIISVLFDIAWLLLYSQIYLFPEPNTGLTHTGKPYFQYIWFVTITQLFIKILYVFTLNRYEYHKLILSLQVQKQQLDKLSISKQNSGSINKNVNDSYVSDMKQFVGLQSCKQSR